MRNTRASRQSGAYLRTISQQIGTGSTRITLTSTSTQSQATIIYTSFNSRFHRTSFLHDAGYLRASNVVLVLRNSHSGQNTDDGYHDHQFNKGETLLHLLFHVVLSN